MNGTTTIVPVNSDLNVVSRLQAVAAARGATTALVFDAAGHSSRRISFAELWDAVDRSSVALRERGLMAGQRAIVMVPMSIELYVVLLAVLKIGAAAVFVDPWIGLRQIAAFAAFAEPSAFIGIGKSHWLRQFEPRLRAIRLSVTTGRRMFAIPARHTLAELLVANGDNHIEPVRADDTALITFTSGSSGTPKGANRTHGFLIAQHETLKHEFPYSPIDVDMPMFPVFALNNLATGITSIIPDIDFRNVAHCNGERVRQQMIREGVCTCTASPPLFDRLADASEDHPEQLTLRRILTGGAPVSDEQLRRWRTVWPESRIEVVYGSTEAEPVAHIEAGERLKLNEQRGSAAGYLLGRPAEFVAWKIIHIRKDPVHLGPDGWAPLLVEPGTPGELVVAGSHVGKDYFRNPEATAENKIVDGTGTVWHRMGDTVYASDDGMLWLVGRIHSTIVRHGTFVHPQQLELVARGDDRRIFHLAAIGMADATLGEAVVVIVFLDGTPARQKPVEVQSIADGVLERLRAAAYPVDRLIVTGEPPPVDPRHNSKIDYSALRRNVVKGRVATLIDLRPPQSS